MKQDLSAFPFEDYASAILNKDTLALVRFHSTWLLPQVMAFLGNNITLVKDENDKYSVQLTLEKLHEDLQANKVLWSGVPVSVRSFMGLLRIISYSPRGDILGSKITPQSKPQNLRWATNVPLFFSAFKEYRNVKYMDWDWSDKEPEIKFVLDPAFMKAREYFFKKTPWTKAQLLEFREMTDNGKPITSRTTITRTGDSEFDHISSAMVKTMLCQTWLFHPSLYTPYGIYNLLDLDAKAEPLVDSEVFEQEEEPAESVELLWKVDSAPTTRKPAWESFLEKRTPNKIKVKDNSSDLPWDI